MLRSMTGYGKAEGAVGSRKYTVEVRSLNGKNLDLSVRMPSVLKEKEMELRKQLGARIVRGKSDVAIHFEADAAEARHELNGPVIEKYVDALRTLAEKTDQPTGNLLSTAVQFPDAMQTSRERLTTKRGKASAPWWWKRPTNSTPSETLKAPHCTRIFRRAWTPSMPWRLRWTRCWTRG